MSVNNAYFLRQARAFSGFTRTEAACVAGCSAGTLALAENGHRQLGSRLIDSLAEVYGVTPEELDGSRPLRSPYERGLADGMELVSQATLGPARPTHDAGATADPANDKVAA